MTRQYRFTDSTKDYLTQFYTILEEMIHNMECAQLNDSVSHNFIVQMIPHHQAAIAMCQNVLQYTNNADLRCIASNIISTQTRSIQNMQSILNQCSCVTNSCQDLNLYNRRFKEVTRTMFHEMGTACSDNNISADFIREMIPHHEGAIGLCENALRYNICPGLAPILESIISSQSRGIQEMRQLLKCITE
ncbi:MAG: DUF305 domain-containing protein [Acetatifactor sp.]|nr:DUF305 domain-containing protein [Acetatifactor sp.]